MGPSHRDDATTCTLAAAAAAEVLGYRGEVVRRGSWIVCLALTIAACGEVTHARLDEWKQTEQGPVKLAAVLASAKASPAMRAHAAENLLVIGESARVLPMLAALPAAPRFELISPLVERLWQRARVTGADDVPGAAQVQAKDWLVHVRGLASMQTASTIDQYLLDWYATPSLEARARLGTHDAVEVMTLLGEMAGPRMRLAVDQLLARPTAKNAYVRVGDDFLAAIAATREPEALRAAWKVATSPRGDASLPGRWIAALHRAQLAASRHGASFAAAVAALQPELTEVARARAPWSATSAMHALELLAQLPTSDCVDIMLEHATQPEAGPLAWVAAGFLVQCGDEAVDVTRDLLPTAARLAADGAPPPASGGRFVPGVVALRRLAAQPHASLRWMALSWLGLCAAGKAVAPEAAACQQVLRDLQADQAVVKVNGKAVVLGAFAQARLAPSP